MLIAAACLLGGQVALQHSADASVQNLCTGYASCIAQGFTAHGYDQHSGTSYWGMDPGHNCTNYVAYVLSVVDGLPTQSYLIGHGDAYQWGPEAQANGVTVDDTPTVGAVAWWNQSAVPSSGHVAIVEQVGAGFIVVSEDDFGGDFHWAKIGPGNFYPTGFIHFLKPPPPPPPPPPVPLDYNHDRVPDVWAVKQDATGTGTTELHIVDGAHPAHFLLQTGTALGLAEPEGRWAFAVADYNHDGVPDLWAIKRDATGTGTTEINVIDGAHPTHFLLQTGTALGLTDPEGRWAFAVADYNHDGVPDLWAIKRDATGTGTTEIDVIDGAHPSHFLLQTGTALGTTDPEGRWAFAVADYNHDGVPDLWAIKRDATGTGTTEIDIIDGAHPSHFLLQTSTALGPTDPEEGWSFMVGDYNRDGVPDVWGIKREATGTGTTELDVIDGAHPSHFLLQTGTALGPTEPEDRWSFAGGG